MDRRCKRRPSTHLQASLIFSLKDLRHYRRFRRQNTYSNSPRSDLDSLPTATQYADFLLFRASERSASSFDALIFDSFPRFKELSAHLQSQNLAQNGEEDVKRAGGVATTCGHRLHPGTPSPAQEEGVPERCPVCLIDCHLTWMRVLTKALDKSGGPRKPRDDSERRHEMIFQAWYAGKLDLVQTAWELQQFTHAEKAWEEFYPMAEISLQGVKSAEMAVEKYWMEEMEIGGEDDMMEAEMLRDEKAAKEKKKVSFDEGTRFEAGRCQAYFCRKSPRYERGKYQCDIEIDFKGEGEGENEDADEDSEAEEEDKNEELESSDMEMEEQIGDDEYQDPEASFYIEVSVTEIQSIQSSFGSDSSDNSLQTHWDSDTTVDGTEGNQSEQAGSSDREDDGDDEAEEEETDEENSEDDSSEEESSEEESSEEDSSEEDGSDDEEYEDDDFEDVDGAEYIVFG